MAVDTFKKGSIEMLALFLLCEQDAHGYQLVQLIKEKSEGLVTVQEGSFYPLLYRLEEDGYISGKETLVKMTSGRSRVRVVYHIEPAGRARLEVLRQEYRKVHEGIRVEYFEDGSYVVTELVVSNPNARTAKSGSKTSTYYGSNNKAIFAVTLTGQFDYTYGVSAKATSASVTVTIYDSSAEYVTKSATYGSATAYGSGTAKVNATSRTLNVKITCDIYGNLT